MSFVGEVKMGQHRSYAEQDYSHDKQGYHAITRKGETYCVVGIFERYQDGTVWAKKNALFEGSLLDCQEFLLPMISLEG
jgi:hypothetical protein